LRQLTDRWWATSRLWPVENKNAAVCGCRRGVHRRGTELKCTSYD
jgi:hypothetical protein